MTDLVDGDQTGSIVDQIDDPEVALADPISIFIARQLRRTARTGFCGQRLNLRNDTQAIGLGAYGLKLLPSGRLDEKAI